MKKLVRLLAITALASTFTQPIFALQKNTSTGSDTTTTTTATTDSTDSTTNSKSKAKTIGMPVLLLQLQKAGYIVKNVDFNKDDVQYKVEAVDRHGDKQSLDVSATTGLSPDQKKVPHETPLIVVVKKFEKNGSYVKAISVDSSNYKVTVVDNKGDEKDYNIDITTGKVS